MINIIIGEDNLNDANKIEKIVKNYMHKIDYKMHVFNDFDKRFLKIIDEELSNKIYLLDIETPSMSGIDVARRIRKNDYTSVIIFLSGHDDLCKIIAKKNLMCLNFINKFDNLEKNLIKSLELALSIVGTKRILHLVSKGVTYNIALNRILYITRDTISRKVTVVCDNATYHLRLNMKDIIKDLTSDFIQIHRSCIVNKTRVSFVDYKKMCITFDDGTSTTLLSRKFMEGKVIE